MSSVDATALYDISINLCTTQMTRSMSIATVSLSFVSYHRTIFHFVWSFRSKCARTQIEQMPTEKKWFRLEAIAVTRAHTKYSRRAGFLRFFFSKNNNWAMTTRERSDSEVKIVNIHRTLIGSRTFIFAPKWISERKLSDAFPFDLRLFSHSAPFFSFLF